MNTPELTPGQAVRVHTIYGEAIEATFDSFMSADRATIKALGLPEGTTALRFLNAVNGNRFTRYPHEIERVESRGQESGR